ncbi:MAG: M1 family metallopeptidase [Planctomycetota bacterium]|nr:M1 family metallopeptidase [Planctomycetota bacterium]
MVLHVPRAYAPLFLLLGCASTAGDRPQDGVPAEARFDVEHYALDLELDPASRSLRGACRIRLWPTRAPLDEVELDLAGLRVDAVVDASGRALEFEQDEDRLRVELAERLALDTYAEFTVRYSGRPAKGLYFTAERDGVPTQAYTHGECVDARAWFPCQDEPWERATSEITVRVPKAWRVFAAGERVERREDGATAFERWRTRFPHPAYLETLVAGEFAVQDSVWDGIPLQFAAAPRLEPQMAATFAETDEVLGFLSQATGVRYPYPKYAQIAVDGFQYGGMENLSATTLVDSAVTDAAGLADAPAAGLVAHEAAHQWFGDLVTCADWSHAWLNEGFATYFADLYTESARGRDAFLLGMSDQRAAWLARDQGENRRPMVYSSPGDPILAFFSGHVYAGGAIRLHHLRRLLGDDVFFRGVRAYLGQNMGRGVVTDDLRRAFEQVSGRDLRAHFERWFFSPGHPRIEFAARHDAEKHEIVIEVSQTQEDAPFPCLLEFEISDGDGIRIARMELDARSRRYVLPAASAPRWVRLDPHCALPAEIVETRTFGEWLALLADGPDAAARRNAAIFLGGHLRATTDTKLWAELVRGLTTAVQLESSEAVRRAVVERLDPKNKSAEFGTLFERAAHDPSPAVRAAAFRVLESVGERAEVANLARAEIGRNESYAAVGAALGALVRTEPGDAFARLVAELRAPSPHGERAARVVAEVARIADPRTAQWMREVARDESLADGPRRAAIAELGRLAGTDAAVRGDLLTLLGSKRGTIRRDSIQALTNALTPEVRARLAAHAEGHADGRERAAIERALASST